MSPFHQVELLHDGRIVQVRRSVQRFETALQLSQERRLLAEKLNAIGRDGRALMIDSRMAPPNTDERLQEEFRRFRAEVARGFERVATLVRTKVGILQVHRLAAEHTLVVVPFDDEAAAIAYLLNGELADGPRSSRRS